MKSIASLFLLVITLTACIDRIEEVKPEITKQSKGKILSKDSVITSLLVNDVVQTEDTLNKIDSNGLKQGVWIEYLHHKLWKLENYDKGELNGKCLEYQANGNVFETFYEKGVKNGYSFHYEPKSTVSKFVTYWENDEKNWSTFPNMIERDLVPIKGFIYIGEDTINVIVPYVSGKTLSKGSIIKDGIPIGEHFVYYENQEIRAIINYDTDSLKIFDIHGNLKEYRALSDLELQVRPNFESIGMF
ncbi:toxin-antitoxin system YwqK family antitoxin [Brumimicrobium mesophilum]|uniref:hypothetical protein n=1 Tax=Brumimicrobium mesophilum TaxID=392717 RepID=UPI000D1405B7|nr:hypothetical protein [Brumimicrobium mesophilum]